MKNKFIIRVDPQDLVPKSYLKGYYWATCWLVVLQAAAILALWRHIPRVVPVFFTEPWGEARLGAKAYLLLLPAIGVVTMFVNLVVARGAKNESEILPFTMAVSALVVTVMLSIALYGILQSLL